MKAVPIKDTTKNFWSNLRKDYQKLLESTAPAIPYQKAVAPLVG